MSGKVTGDDGWVALEKNYRHRYVSKIPSLVAGILVSAVILIIAAVSLKSGVKWMSVWLWIASSAVVGFATAYFLNLYLECRHPENRAYCDARQALSLGKAIDSRPVVAAMVRV